MSLKHSVTQGYRN